MHIFLMHSTLIFFKWFIYVYFWYFCIIFVLSLFDVKLGFSAFLVRYMNQIFKYVNDSRKIKRIVDDENKIGNQKTTPTIGNDIYGKLYNATILQNGEIPKYSTTIKRDIILLPEFQGTLFNQLMKNTEDDISEFTITRRSVYQFSDISMYVRAGIEAIVEDQITSRFEREKIESWNLLTRTNPHLHFYNWKVSLLWLSGLLFRYLILLPARTLNCLFGISLLSLSMTCISYVPESKLKEKIYRRAHLTCFAILGRWLGSVITFHNLQNRPKRGVAVCNHTTPFDVLNLCTDNCYSLTGQRHGGFIGMLEMVLNKASPHIWFDRSSIADRELVTKKLRQHVNDETNPPILIFPEGTCINNTAVTQFKKGAFEIGAVIYPVAIKYDPRYGDAFWNSNKQSASQHIFEMMTSWAVVADVWYLSPIYMQPLETSVQFANRVKGIIAKQLNVIDLAWDGQVKRIKPKPEWKELHQKLFYEKLKARLRTANA